MEKQTAIGSRIQMDIVGTLDEHASPYEAGFPVVIEAKAYKAKVGLPAVRQLVANCVIRQHSHRNKLGILFATGDVTSVVRRTLEDLSSKLNGRFLLVDGKLFRDQLQDPREFRRWLFDDALGI